MINTIKICPDGHMIPESDCLGRTGERKATVLKFDIFEELNGKSASDFRKELVAVNSQGSFKYELADEFTIPIELTTDTELSLQVKLYDADELVFKSNPHIFNFVASIDDSGNNTIQSVVDEAKEAYRTSLASSVSVATGDDHSGKTWDELNDTVSTLPVISEEQTQALGDWDLIKAYFENYRGNSHHLFNIAPKDAEGNAIPYKLPYIYTPEFPWRADMVMLSAELLEVGVDVSSAVNLGGGGTNRTFSPLPKLEKLVLTGNANTPSLYNFMSTNYELKYIKMDTPSETALMANAEYYRRAFYCCERLQTIDCELDFTGQTVARDTFTNCLKLKDLKIRPFTLSTSLNLGSCQILHLSGSNNYDSLISVLNGITLDREIAKNITITFSNAITDFTTDDGFWNCNVWPQNDGSYTEEESDTIFAHPVSLYSAFINKGVTIAWK